ncbi:inositol 2-dehydrogenase [Mycobacterium sp. PS03-16]|nr:Gfo/Idh/MocA family oxidoreductase [Mycobacterium sp. PS03-16]TFV59646.1 inositol 2-dehydrogenase [Mycobacterium sp. PS03-16]
MTPDPELRIAVVGVGVMGADHVARITDRITGARVSVVNDVSAARAAQVAAMAPGARVEPDPVAAIAADDVDAVLLASPGPVHEPQLLTCLEHRKPVLCEKPLTTDPASALEVVRREAARAAPLIQVGFMRRFDPEYRQLKDLLDAGKLGRPLVMHCVHRNPSVPPSFDSAMVVKDSLAHEVDVTRFLFGEEIASVQIIAPTPNPGAPRGIQDPQIAIFATASGAHVDAEVFVTTGVGYEVRTEIVGQHGNTTIGRRVTPGFREHFATAYDIEVQCWVDAVRRGAAAGSYVDGPTAWDGYAAAAVCAAAVESLGTGQRVSVELAARP